MTTPVSVTTPSVSIEPSMWNFTIGALAILFIIYITMKDELPTYIKLLLYSPPTATPVAATATASSSTGTPTASQTLNAASTLLQAVGK